MNIKGFIVKRELRPGETMLFKEYARDSEVKYLFERSRDAEPHATPYWEDLMEIFGTVYVSEHGTPYVRLPDRRFTMRLHPMRPDVVFTGLWSGLLWQDGEGHKRFEGWVWIKREVQGLYRIEQQRLYHLELDPSKQVFQDSQTTLS